MGRKELDFWKQPATTGGSIFKTFFMIDLIFVCRLEDKHKSLVKQVMMGLYFTALYLAVYPVMTLCVSSQPSASLQAQALTPTDTMFLTYHKQLLVEK